MVGTVTLKSHRFRTEREESWRELEIILKAIEGRGMKSLTDAQIVALPRLYRSTLSSLSVARATSLDQGVIIYLESLSARAYYILYGSQVSLGKRITSFFLRDWPMAAKALWKETVISAALTLLAAVLAFILVKSNPDWFYMFMPDSMAQGRTPAASADVLRETLYHDGDESGLGILLHIGKAVAFPGDLSRTQAASKAGGTASLLMAGVVIMLFFAGLLEGFGRQLITSDLIRYAIGLGTLTLWLIYFYGPRRAEAEI